MRNSLGEINLVDYGNIKAHPYSGEKSTEEIRAVLGEIYEGRLGVEPFEARGFELDRRHPVATLQLAGEAMIEIDEIGETQGAPAGICQGVACVTFHCAGESPENALRPAEGPLASYAEYIATLPLTEAPEVFGMHENANITFQSAESRT